MSNNDGTPIHRVSRHDGPRGNLTGRDFSFRKTAYARIGAEQSHLRPFDPTTLARLPATADEIYGLEIERTAWQNTIMTLFAGTRDPGSPLSMLRDYNDTLLREIGMCATNEWARHIKLTLPAYLVGSAYISGLMQFNHGRRDHWHERAIHERDTKSHGFDNGFVSFTRVGHVNFPPARGRNVNMMPFIFGDKTSLPDSLKCYFDLIEQCPYMKEDIGKVGYLTVHESYVDVGEAQRREGLHIESPGFFSDDDPSFTPGLEHRWGMGVFFGPDFYDGGIFMASNKPGTSKVWNALVDSRAPGIVDRHGGCEHLRELFGDGTVLEAGELIWMTDMTPHEALQQKESGIRQFFRVVTPSITHWYKDHCTENPMVPLPSNVIIVEGNKFGDLYDVNEANETSMPFIFTSPLEEEKETARKTEKKQAMKKSHGCKGGEKPVKPEDLFKTGIYKEKYCQFDDSGIPTQNADGEQVGKKERKKCLIRMEKYKKKLEKNKRDTEE